MDVEELTGKAPNEIADLDSAVLEQIGDRSYLNLIEDGLTFVINDNQIIAAHLYGGDKEGFNRFPFRLPLGVAFDMSRESLRAHLGSGLADQSQKMTVAARAMAEKNVVGQRS